MHTWNWEAFRTPNRQDKKRTRWHHVIAKTSHKTVKVILKAERNTKSYIKVKPQTLQCHSLQKLKNNLKMPGWVGGKLGVGGARL